MRALLAVSFVLLAALVVPTFSLTFCQTYATALSLSQEELIETVVGAVITTVAAPEAVTVPYFAGGVVKNGARQRNFLRGPYATANVDDLATALSNYFGYILGCQQGASGNTDTLFPNPLLFEANLTAVHAFQPPIPGAAFEFFNRALLSVLANAGVAGADVKTVAIILDSLRLGQTVSSSPVVNTSNIVCQDKYTCPRGPFLVYLTLSAQGKYYPNPPYLGVPIGQNVTFLLDSSASGQHNVLQDSSYGVCTEIVSPLIACTAFPCSVTIAGSAGSTLYYYDGYQCSGGAAFGEIGILPALAVPTEPNTIPTNPQSAYLTDPAVMAAPVPNSPTSAP